LGDNDPWAANPTNSNKNIYISQKSNNDTDSDDFFPPLSSLKPSNSSNGLSGPANNALNDPWSVNASSANKINGIENDPWKTSSTTNQTTTNPWLSNNASSNLQADPWSESTNEKANKIDDFDLFTSKRVNTPTNTSNGASGNNLATPADKNTNDPFGDFFISTSTNSDSKNSTNPWNNNPNSSTVLFQNNITIVNSNNNTNNSAKAINPTRKTPESFLGENSSLVNLDNLIPTRPKSTNPFGSTITNTSSNITTGGLTSSTSSSQINNPFLTQQQLNQKGPTISQLQQQSTFLFSQTSGVNARATPTPTIMQPLIPTNTSGQLAQPLIPPQYPSTPMPNFTGPATGPLSGFGNSFNINTNNNQPNNNNTTNPFLMM
jgi:hypothetical protein